MLKRRFPLPEDVPAAARSERIRDREQQRPVFHRRGGLHGQRIGAVRQTDHQLVVVMAALDRLPSMLNV